MGNPESPYAKGKMEVLTVRGDNSELALPLLLLGIGFFQARAPCLAIGAEIVLPSPPLLPGPGSG